MVNINPNRESCMEYMKELIRKGLPSSELILEVMLVVLVGVVLELLLHNKILILVKM